MSEPLISVVIPCRNEAKSIATTVRAILASRHQNLEVLVVDGMSEDGTRGILAGLSQEDPRVRMIDNEKKLTPYAFNLGVRHARGEFVQIVGSRNTLAPDYLSLLARTLNERPDVACVGGDYQHVHDSDEGRYITLAMESKFGVGGGNYRTMSQDAHVDTVGVPMYRASIFAEIGLFDENLTRNQDDDFNFRVTRAGHKILYVHDAKTTYLVRGSLKKAFKQFQQYGYFKVYVNRKHGAVTTMRQLVPAAWLAFWVIGLPLALWRPGVASLLALAGVVYLLTGLSLAGRGLTLRERFLVLRACVVLHTAYATGYWIGIWDFLMNTRAPRLSMQRQTT